MYRREKKPDIYLISGNTDFRKGIDSLCQLLVEEYDLDVFSNAIFIFCAKRKDRLKILYWGGAGFWLLIYRLEEGKFKWIKENDVKSITYKQLEWLLDGLEINPKNYHFEVTKRLI